MVSMASPTASTTTARAARTRELPDAATFGDLVASAAEVEASERASDARCGLRAGADGRYRLEANLTPSLVKTAPIDLDEAAPFIGRVALATPFGVVGNGSMLVALSPLPQRIRLGIVPVVSVTDKAIYFSIATNQGISEGPATTIDEKNLHVVRGMIPNADAVIVTAERDVPLDRVRDVLDWTDGAAGPVVFGVFLGRDDHVPATWVNAREPDGFVEEPGRCENGEHYWTVPGRYDPATVARVSDEIRQEVASCAAKLPPDSLGGRVTLSLKMGRTGRTADACLGEDQTQSAEVRACVLDRVRKLPFPSSPKPVAVSVQVQLVPPSLITRGLCE
ncbi:hypothetical protein D187_003891 [Cystobacter fuscus DSM 2262]|uniref:TonB C-terminal domain-containing protein n=1 Tax=Cystobacter fuscus (strain ATCC 25194 / DSM 2262 / NBRC 100088 / M29) TaxID=1242864 RepID=S9QAQ8_CYSF2|nr:hypothetical protein D187_003891 [Cystobacter fuscus DSM 2262]